MAKKQAMTRAELHRRIDEHLDVWAQQFPALSDQDMAVQVQQEVLDYMTGQRIQNGLAQ